MKTRPGTLLTIFSLTLCGAFVALALTSFCTSVCGGWVYSHWTAGHWEQRSDLFIAENGQFRLQIARRSWPMQTAGTAAWSALTPDARARFAEFRNTHPETEGFTVTTTPASAASTVELLKTSLGGFEWFQPAGVTSGRWIGVPAWLPILLCALLPARRFSKSRFIPRGSGAPLATA